jgi:hypothetical protein
VVVSYKVRIFLRVRQIQKRKRGQNEERNQKQTPMNGHSPKHLLASDLQLDIRLNQSAFISKSMRARGRVFQTLFQSGSATGSPGGYFPVASLSVRACPAIET